MARLVPLSDSLTRSGDSFHVSTCHSMTYPIKGPDVLRICAMKTEGHAAPPTYHKVACLSQFIVLWNFATSSRQVK